MNNKTTISIIMPVYNCDKYIAEAIESVRSQTYQDFELIIIDDFSTDQSNKIALEYSQKDDRIKVIQNKYEKGLPGALNSGIEICSGEFIARADADDILIPYRFSTQIDFLNKNPSIDIVGGGYQLFGQKKEIKKFHTSDSPSLAWKFITNTHFCHPSVIFRKKVLETIQYYPNVSCEDFAFFSQIIQKHKGANINKILIKYRQHELNYSNIEKEYIAKSVKETFLKNFEFYAGNLEKSEIFYYFHSKYELSLKNIFFILKTSFKIAKKIAQNNYIFLEKLNLYFTIQKHIIFSIGHYYMKKLILFIK